MKNTTSIKKTAIALIISAFIAPAAFADNNDWTWVGGEAGWAFTPTPSTKSRTEVARELEAFRSNPVAADGWRYAGPQLGYLPPQHGSKLENGQWVHADNIDHSTPKPSLAATPAERKRYQDLYSGGA